MGHVWSLFRVGVSSGVGRGGQEEAEKGAVFRLLGRPPGRSDSNKKRTTLLRQVSTDCTHSDGGRKTQEQQESSLNETGPRFQHCSRAAFFRAGFVPLDRFAHDQPIAPTDRPNKSPKQFRRPPPPNDGHNRMLGPRQRRRQRTTVTIGTPSPTPPPPHHHHHQQQQQQQQQPQQPHPCLPRNRLRVPRHALRSSHSCSRWAVFPPEALHEFSRNACVVLEPATQEETGICDGMLARCTRVFLTADAATALCFDIL